SYQHRQTNSGVFSGWSAGRVDGWTRRHTVGLTYMDNSYASIPGESPAGELPADLTLAVPYYRIDLIEDRYRTGINFNQIGKPEDFNVGLDASLQLGRSLAALGSTRQQWIYSTRI